MDRREQIKYMQRRLTQGWRNSHIIEDMEISRATYFRWKQKLDKQGIEKLINKEKPGPKPSFHINSSTSKMIIHWRKRFGWGPNRIEGHLNQHHGIHVPHNRIYQLIVNKGLNEPIARKRKTWGKKRWEREHSMSLLQADWKDVRTDPGPMLTYIDDHSRYILGSRRFDEASTYNSIRLLESVCKKYGYPEQVLTDNGTQFCNNHNDNPSQFTQFCLDNGIEHIRTSKKRPTTTGKIEAFHGCYEREAWRFNSHEAYIRHWNHARPNGAIGYLYPVEVFFKDMKKSH